MEVILQQSVEKLGHPGDVVKVSNGYARNYLLPRGIAVVATEGNKKQIEAQRQRLEALRTPVASRRSPWSPPSRQSLSRSRLALAKRASCSVPSPRVTSSSSSRPSATRWRSGKSTCTSQSRHWASTVCRSGSTPT